MVTTMTSCTYCFFKVQAVNVLWGDPQETERDKTHWFSWLQLLVPSLFHFCSRYLWTKLIWDRRKDLTSVFMNETSLSDLTDREPQPAIARFILAKSRKFLRNIVPCTFIFALFSVMGKTPKRSFYCKT